MPKTAARPFTDEQTFAKGGTITLGEGLAHVYRGKHGKGKKIEVEEGRKYVIFKIEK